MRATAPSYRALYTSRLTGAAGVANREDFLHTSDGGVLTATELDVTFPPASGYPGSIATDAEGVDEGWRGIGIRIEDDVVVTEDGHEVLTGDIPKEIDDVETACA